MTRNLVLIVAIGLAPSAALSGPSLKETMLSINSKFRQYNDERSGEHDPQWLSAINGCTLETKRGDRTVKIDLNQTFSIYTSEQDRTRITLQCGGFGCVRSIVEGESPTLQEKYSFFSRSQDGSHVLSGLDYIQRNCRD